MGEDSKIGIRDSVFGTRMQTPRAYRSSLLPIRGLPAFSARCRLSPRVGARRPGIEGLGDAGKPLEHGFMKQSTTMVAGGLVVAAALAFGLTRGVVAQSGTTAPQAARIAVVDMIGIVDRLMSQGAFKAARDQYDAQQLAAQDQIKQQYEAITADVTARLEKAATDDEKAKINEERDAKLGELQARYQGMQGETEQFTVNMLADAYKLAVETAGKIARAQGYTHVVSSRTNDIPRDRGSQLAFQEILLRHVAVLPEGDDLTKMVEKELKLDEVPAAGPEAPKAAAPAAEAPKADAPKAETPAAPK